MLCIDKVARAREFNLIVTPVKDFIVPIKPILEKKKTIPCGTDCSNCTLYTNNRCLGCPASVNYRGSLL